MTSDKIFASALLLCLGVYAVEMHFLVYEMSPAYGGSVDRLRHRIRRERAEDPCPPAMEYTPVTVHPDGA